MICGGRKEKMQKAGRRWRERKERRERVGKESQRGIEKGEKEEETKERQRGGIAKETDAWKKVRTGGRDKDRKRLKHKETEKFRD